MTIEIETLFAGGSPCGVFCKGDIPDDDFIEAVRDFDEYQDEDNADSIEPGMIKRVVVRCIPYHKGDFDFLAEEDGVYFRASKPGRGAFTITYVDFEDAIAF